MSSLMPQPEMAPIVACTISRDVQNFDLLIEDMETALGEAWGDLGFAEALTTYGILGVKVWIFKGEVIGEREEAGANNVQSFG